MYELPTDISPTIKLPDLKSMLGNNALCQPASRLDDVGAYIGGGIAIGTRRLNIIDIEDVHQPMLTSIVSFDPLAY